MSEQQTQKSPNAAFMQNDPNRVGITQEGAELLEAFMLTHQQALDNPEAGQRNRDGVSVLAGDGSVISVIMKKAEDGTSFRVAKTSLSGLHAGQEPQVKDEPYGFQWRDGYMRVPTDIGLLKYQIDGKEAEVLPKEGEEPVPVVTIASLLEAQKLQPASAAPQPEQISVGGILRLLRRRK